MMTLGLLLILCVLYLPGGLASVRRETFSAWGSDIRGWWRGLRGDKKSQKQEAAA
jgi:branched-chain amino acid transport system permease protein